jgi:putative SOS response-associated peptidase YedK
MIALKALKQYFEATNDKRVLVLMDKFFRYQYFNLQKHPLRTGRWRAAGRTCAWRCGFTTSPARAT